MSLTDSFERTILSIAPTNRPLFAALDKIASASLVTSDEEDSQEATEPGTSGEVELKTKEDPNTIRALLAKTRKGKLKKLKGKAPVGEADVKDEPEESDNKQEDSTEKVARLTSIAYLSH